MARVLREPEGRRWPALLGIAALWSAVSLFAAGPVTWLVAALSGLAHMPAATTSRVFVGAVDALVYAVLAFAVFSLAGKHQPPARYAIVALAGYLLGQAGYLVVGWLADGGTAGLNQLDPALIAVEAMASTLGAAGAVAFWSVQRGSKAQSQD